MNIMKSYLFFAMFYSQVSHGNSIGRLRGSTYPHQSIHRDVSYSCSSDDLSTLVAIIRALEERDCGSNPPPPNGSLCNAEDLIMNLVNALIDLSTQALSQRHCHCPSGNGYNNNPSYPGHNGGSGNNYPGHPNYNGGSGYSHSDGGLLDLDLLNQNKKDNVLDLDLARQHLLGVGLGGGGGSSQSSNGYYDGRDAKGNDEGLVEVDLLNPHKKGNVADVDLGKQHLVGVGLGGGGGQPSHPSSTTGSGTSSNSGEGVNVDLLNPQRKNNVADVEIDRHSVIGIGLGN